MTLVGQGPTFAPLLRRLGLRENAAEAEQVRNEARLAAIAAGMAAIADLLAHERISPALAESLRATLTARADRLQHRITTMAETDDGRISWPADYEASLTARRAIIEAQRRELLHWRDSGRLPDAALRELRRELDHEERGLPGH